MRIGKIVSAATALTLVLTACGTSQGSDSPATTAAAVAEAAPVTTTSEVEASPTTEPVASGAGTAVSYPVVDTGQTACYDAQGAAISCPEEGEAFLGQDGNHVGAESGFLDNGDGTVTDLNTGLMWQQDPGAKLTYAEALDAVESADLAGYDDWRLPTIKELYSLIDFSGTDPSGCQSAAACDAVPFIDTDYFAFAYGDTDTGERMIDSQWATSTIYESTTMGGNPTMFGVNFADGRIKGYPISDPQGGEKTFFVIYVRGNTSYGTNDFADNGDGTVSDAATGLTWQLDDSGTGMDWADALEYCEALEVGGYGDWRLPDAKELQSIVDYARSPATTGSAALDPVFTASTITDEGGNQNWGFYWSGTTHASLVSGGSAAYLAFGEALGWMQDPGTGEYTLMDVHGAGSQRSDPKSGDAADYPYGHGLQGDVIRVENLVRCVRDGSVEVTSGGEVVASTSSGADTGGPAQGGPLAEAAALLGVSEQALAEALGDPSQGPPDVANAARVLGISEDEIRAVLPDPPG